MTAGRPTKYTPELLEKAHKYVNGEFLLDGVIPSIEGLALFLEIARETCHTWRHEEGKEEFSDILEKVLAKQAVMTINGALNNEFNASIAKLLLGKHGYSDRSTTDITSGGKPIKNEWHLHPVTVKE